MSVFELRVQLWTQDVTVTSQIGAEPLHKHEKVCIFYMYTHSDGIQTATFFFNLNPFFLAVTAFIIISLADIQVGYEFRIIHSVHPYTLVANSTLRSVTKTPEVKRKVGPVGLLEAATAPC